MNETSLLPGMKSGASGSNSDSETITLAILLFIESIRLSEREFPDASRFRFRKDKRLDNSPPLLLVAFSGRLLFEGERDIRTAFHNLVIGQRRANNETISMLHKKCRQCANISHILEPLVAILS
jgi:hypothetical protein